MMWKSFLPHLLCLLLQLKLCLSLRQCKWFLALSETRDLEGLLSNYIHQEEIRNVADFFMDLKDSPINPNDKDAVSTSYLGVYERQESRKRILFLDPPRILSKAWKPQERQMDPPPIYG